MLLNVNQRKTYSLIKLLLLNVHHSMLEPHKYNENIRKELIELEAEEKRKAV
jgi:hypothetical protein